MAGGWGSYERARERSFLAGLAAMLLLCPGGVLASRLGVNPWLGLIPSFVCLALVIWYGAHIHEFPCPRCGKPFFRFGPFPVNPMFVKRCPNCGLEKWTQQADPPFKMLPTPPPSAGSRS
jgi:predicted RNA-binding Zn-ribbon protein involved in translation (DUF1610 family)